ncbi:hypothetical protein H109_07008 [Trichophyton interdigitale MR816]|uniref:L-ornithine N(5)-oxygenase n=1 Tax=Trichophyton interdigitale (strain MR816) TaxID=1215338 RepID=A0A059J009_TRIIM|nr:hypothetical protein H101_03492 [Trichophyton interdigitale H6]KDB21043.1 hypothetical protein H109_07008 [Trichophyton interdigitale MR816]
MDGQQSGSSFTDAVIVGNGPSALILSYILHGNIPYYNLDSPHPDPILHAKLRDATELLRLDVARLTNHFEASRFSYSTQSLPINSLVDSLVRPFGETDDRESASCVSWHHDPQRAVPHLCLGDALQPGGQWTECPPGTTWDIQSLSYAGMLSLPGYSFYDHYYDTHGVHMPSYTRPSRQAIAEYLAAYPAAVGIGNSIQNGQLVSGVARTDDGFYIASHRIHCKHLVLASGIFTEVKPARPLLQPLLSLPAPPDVSTTEKAPLLVIGSGFSAADIIISAPRDQKIIHIFKWEPEINPSPLRSCHQQAYPEYAGIYKLMKRSTLAKFTTSKPNKRNKSSLSPFLTTRDWDHIYEALPNTLVVDVEIDGTEGIVTFRCSDGSTITRRVSGLSYAVGRKGSLAYLDHMLQREILGAGFDQSQDASIAKDTLKSAAVNDLEVANGVFIIGSLTSDSLIRYAYGGCIYAAGKLMERYAQRQVHPTPCDGPVDHTVPGQPQPDLPTTPSPNTPMNILNHTKFNNNKSSNTVPSELRMHRVSSDLKLGSKSDRFGSRRQRPWWAFIFSS